MIMVEYRLLLFMKWRSWVAVCVLTVAIAITSSNIYMMFLLDCKNQEMRIVYMGGENGGRSHRQIIAFPDFMFCPECTTNFSAVPKSPTTQQVAVFSDCLTYHLVETTNHSRFGTYQACHFLISLIQAHTSSSSTTVFFVSLDSPLDTDP